MKKRILPLISIFLGILLLSLLYAEDASACTKNRLPVIEKGFEDSFRSEAKVEAGTEGSEDATKITGREETLLLIPPCSQNSLDCNEAGAGKHINTEEKIGGGQGNLSAGDIDTRNGLINEPKVTASEESLPVCDRGAGKKIVDNSPDSLCSGDRSLGSFKGEPLGIDGESRRRSEEEVLGKRLPVVCGLPISSGNATEEDNTATEGADKVTQDICVTYDLTAEASVSAEPGAESVGVQVKESSGVERERPLLALKTNLLFDVALMPNVEIEVPIGKRWSVSGEYMFPWWVTRDNRYCLQMLSGGVEGRYWLGSAESRKHREALTGHFIGLYVGGGEYDLQWKENGYQGEFFIAAGISYGWSTGIARNLHLEMSIGIGVMSTDYRHYHAINNYRTLLWQGNGKYTWIGPTKAKISLVWVLNRKAWKGGSK